jgi:hypothetical protein
MLGAVRHQRAGEDLEEEGHCGDGRGVDALLVLEVPVAEFTLGVLTFSRVGRAQRPQQGRNRCGGPLRSV